MAHIGSIVKQSIRTIETKKIAIARSIQASPISIDRYIQQKSLQCYTLFNLSKALNVNLFGMIAKCQQLENIPCADIAGETLKQRITDLEKELAIYKEIVRGKMS
jgi:hypothetical protein